jgi:protein-tyrosine phosphatase
VPPTPGQRSTRPGERPDAARTLEAGAEYLYSERFLDALERDEELLTWRENGRERRHVLVELPLRDPSVGVDHIGRRLVERGIVPVMAHPERVVQAQFNPAHVERWVESGWLLQLDLLSLAGSYGRESARLAERLLTAGRYHFTGSDLHRPVQLGALEAAWEAYHRLTARAATQAE